MLGGVSLVPLETVALSVRMDMKLIEKILVCVVSNGDVKVYFNLVCCGLISLELVVLFIVVQDTC